MMMVDPRTGRAVERALLELEYASVVMRRYKHDKFMRNMIHRNFDVWFGTWIDAITPKRTYVVTRTTEEHIEVVAPSPDEAIMLAQERSGGMVVKVAHTLDQVSQYYERMTIAEFEKDGFTPDDGEGYYGTEFYETSVDVFSGEKPPHEATHVWWYNK